MALDGRVRRLESARRWGKRPACAACCGGIVATDGSEGEGEPICPACGWPPSLKIIFSRGVPADL